MKRLCTYIGLIVFLGCMRLYSANNCVSNVSLADHVRLDATDEPDKRVSNNVLADSTKDVDYTIDSEKYGPSTLALLWLRRNMPTVIIAGYGIIVIGMCAFMILSCLSFRRLNAPPLQQPLFNGPGWGEAMMAAFGQQIQHEPQPPPPCEFPGPFGA